MPKYKIQVQETSMVVYEIELENEKQIPKIAFLLGMSTTKVIEKDRWVEENEVLDVRKIED